MEMNILVLAQGAHSASRGYFGGGSIVLHEHAKRWVAAGHRVRVVASRRARGEPPEEEFDGVEIERRGSLATSIPVMWKAYRDHATWADVAVENLLSFPLYSPLWVRHPLVVFSYHLMGGWHFRASGFLKGAVGFALEAGLGPSYRKASFVVDSVLHQQQLIQRGVDPANVVVAYPGVDTTTFVPGEKSETPLISFVGSFRDGRKRVDHLVKAFFTLRAEFPELRLVIAGYGGDREKAIYELVKKEEGIQFLGTIDELTKRSLYQKSWVFVNPSLMEGFSMTAIEANACGTPVVAYEIPGLETIVHGHNGLLAERGNPRSLVQQLRILLADRELRTRMGERAVEHARQFSWEKAATQSLSLLRRLASRWR